jgi:hypothetical protein
VSDYSEMMDAVAELKRNGGKIQKPEEKRMAQVSSSAASGSARDILANDNTSSRRAPVPPYVPPANVRVTAVALDPDDVDDLYSIGEHQNGTLWLKWTSLPNKVFVFSGVPVDVVKNLRTALSRDDFYQVNIKDRYPFDVVTAPAKK